MAERNILTLDDLGLLLEELRDVHTKWYALGALLKVSTRTLDGIVLNFSDPTCQLQEMLMSWLTTNDNPSWKTVTDALRSVGASLLADFLEAKYCLMEDTLERNKLTLDDLGLLLEELLVAHTKWYALGLLLRVRVEILERIRRMLSNTVQVREMLNAWLTTADNPSWKTVTDALRSMGASQLADDLEAKYCLVEDMHTSTSSQ